jgi:flagellar motor switch/type III secretory pathway protein FliN
MSDLNPENAAAIVAACTVGAEEAAGALARALGGEFKLALGELTVLAADSPPEGFDGAGLVVLLRAGERGVALALPAASGLVPDWCGAPDASGESRLATLAQELGMLLVPESVPVSDYQARLVENVQESFERAKLAADASLLPITVTCGEKTAQLSMLWPLESPGELFATAAANADADDAPPSAAASEEPPLPMPKAARAPSLPQPRDLTSLPGYSRSLLKIRVPVSVQLASKKEPVQEVISLAPGSIIKFEKGCEELLQMIVGEHTVAEGEAVKIGEKFGFRVTNMKLPPEHFVPVKKRVGSRQ